MPAENPPPDHGDGRPARGSRLVLASTSPHRRLLLERLRLPFHCLAPDVDEARLAGERPRDRALRLAIAKARAGAAALAEPDALVIGSDQVADLEGRIQSKPGSIDRAIEQLEAASGRTLHFHTAVAVHDTRTGNTEAGVELTTVTLRRLTRDRIRAYVHAEMPLDAAGSFYSEALGIALLDRLEGRDPTALIGLPLMLLIDLLDAAGLDVLRSQTPQPGSA
jgi:septum formation protein